MVHLNKISTNACTNDRTHVSVLNGSREVHTYSRKVTEHTYELYVCLLLVTSQGVVLTTNKYCLLMVTIFVDGHVN